MCSEAFFRSKVPSKMEPAPDPHSNHSPNASCFKSVRGEPRACDRLIFSRRGVEGVVWTVGGTLRRDK